MLLASLWLKIYRVFKLVILLTLSSSKLIVILLTFGNSQFNLLLYYSEFQQVKVTLLSLGKMLDCKKISKPPLLDKKFRNHGKGLALVIFNDSIKRNEELSSPVNEETSKVQSFIPFCNMFFWFVWKNEICMIRIKTQKVLDNWGNIF